MLPDVDMCIFSMNDKRIKKTPITISTTTVQVKNWTAIPNFDYWRRRSKCASEKLLHLKRYRCGDQFKQQQQQQNNTVSVPLWYCLNHDGIIP